ncbi:MULTISPECIES: hypothetical protein [unclassified Cupriavidus]|uniref:hypothetical protein n=1 Tax=unclassified Cupriavidus TaxID=2640874 RepID=UPI0010F46D59|nr:MULTISPECIES: hypothetical protein [unclassified Cupriavidus]MWL86713.1 hypothetical protein [Cupriavidus sp. SW-Y-13]
MPVQGSTRYRIPQLERPQWLACMQGGVRVLDGGLELAVLTSGDVFVPEPGRSLVLHTVVDSVIGRTIALKRRIAEEDVSGRGEFLAIEPGEPNWAQHFDAVGLCWAACHHGALSLQWRDPTMPDGLATILLQAGMSFAPAPGEEYCIDALLPGTGLLCCHRGSAASPARARARQVRPMSAPQLMHAVA